MGELVSPFARAETYLRFLYGVSALPLGIVTMVVLFAGWGLTVGLAITPLVVPLFIGLWFVVRQLAQTEAYLVRQLLEADVSLPSQRTEGGFWRRLGHAFTDGAFWKQQAYLLLRVGLGWPLAILQLSLVVSGLWFLGLPIYYRWLDEGDVVGRRVDTLPEALAFVPVGLVVLLVTAHLVRPLSRIWERIAVRLLGSDARPVRTASESSAARRRALTIFAVAVGGISLLLVCIWVLTTPGEYFWPIQAILPLALPLVIVAWVFRVLDDPRIERRLGDSRALAIHAGVSAAIWLYLVLEWLISDRGYFWPGWVLLGLGIAFAIHACVVFASMRTRTGSGRSRRPGPAPSTCRRRSSGGSSATCTTARRRGSSRSA
jgi:Putative sensor/2TM domain